MKNRALVVIDMQYVFETSQHQPTIQAILALIEAFKRQNRPILIVEYEKSSRWSEEDVKTLFEIREAVKDYSLAKTVIKPWDDGSEEISNALGENSQFELDLFLCGVNAGACVKLTACGLVRLGFDITVVTDACNGPTTAEEAFGYHSQVYKGIRLDNKQNVVTMVA